MELGQVFGRPSNNPKGIISLDHLWYMYTCTKFVTLIVELILALILESSRKVLVAIWATGFGISVTQMAL